MPDDKARCYARKWREGRTPYSRIRRHAVRLQLDAVIALALQLCLRRREIFALDTNCVSAENAYVVVAGYNVPWTERARAVPFSESARKAIADWLDYRLLLGADHDRPWVALHAGPTVGQPMKPAAFDSLLRTYVGPGWSLKRLRDTGAVRWVNRGMNLEHLRQLLGHAAIEDTLPFARLAGGDLERRMDRLESRALPSLAANPPRTTGIPGIRAFARAVPERIQPSGFRGLPSESTPGTAESARADRPAVTSSPGFRARGHDPTSWCMPKGPRCSHNKRGLLRKHADRCSRQCRSRRDSGFGGRVCPGNDQPTDRT